MAQGVTNREAILPFPEQVFIITIDISAIPIGNTGFIYSIENLWNQHEYNVICCWHSGTMAESTTDLEALLIGKRFAIISAQAHAAIAKAKDLRTPDAAFLW